MSKSTMFELVDELKKLPDCDEIREMIAEARAGEYHDYKNKKYICGKFEVIQRLRKLRHIDLANRITNGEFDEEPDEEDLAAMKPLLEHFEEGYLDKLLASIGEK